MKTTELQRNSEHVTGHSSSKPRDALLPGPTLYRTPLPPSDPLHTPLPAQLLLPDKALPSRGTVSPSEYATASPVARLDPCLSSSPTLEDGRHSPLHRSVHTQETGG